MSAPTENCTALPRFVQIEPVGQCNLRCRMCPIQYRTDGTPDHNAALRGAAPPVRTAATGR